MAVAMIALFIALGGTAFAFSSNNGSSTADRAGGGGALTLRFGKLVDRDTTPFDGSFFFATGHAICKKGERVISGGIRQIAGGAGVISHIWTVESGPVPQKRGWYVSMNSDLGGAARSDFVAVANCERK
ncbi:MAG: hypothetical protein ACTHN7_03255 [Solirubrobacterales bacterium]